MRFLNFRSGYMGYGLALVLGLATAWGNGYSLFGTNGNSVKRRPDAPKKGGIGYIGRGPLHK